MKVRTRSLLAASAAVLMAVLPVASASASEAAAPRHPAWVAPEPGSSSSQGDGVSCLGGRLSVRCAAPSVVVPRAAAAPHSARSALAAEVSARVPAAAPAVVPPSAAAPHSARSALAADLRSGPVHDPAPAAARRALASELG